MLDSLRGRLTAAGVALAVIAVGVTTVVVTNTTSADLIADLEDRLDAQSFVLSELTTYAVTVGSWDGVGQVVAELAEEVGVRVAVTDLDGNVLADSEPDGGEGLLAAAYIDPTNPLFDAALDQASIDEASRVADLIGECLDGAGVPYFAEVDEFGLPFVVVDSNAAADFEAEEQCYAMAFDDVSFDSTFEGLFDDAVAEPAVLFLGANPRPSIDWQAVSLLAAAVAGALALASWWFSARLSRPVAEMAAATAAIREGDMSARVHTADRTEIGALATAFNQMAAELGDAADRRRRFTSDVAHELRTPLANITSHVQAVVDGVESPSAETLSVVQSEVDHVARLVDDLQQLSLVDEGQLNIDPFDVVLADVVDQVIVGNEARAVAENVTLVASGRAEAMVSVDPLRLRQALDNLVSNAIRHTPAGGAVTVSVAQDDSITTIAVRDTGPGIPDEFLLRVFERFSRADAARGRTTGGSGLGLPIARELIRLHGGDITAENLAGGGAQFTVVLPHRTEG